MPELGVVVRRSGQVKLRRIGLLRGRQLRDVPVEPGAQRRVAGQRAAAAEDLGGGIAGVAIGGRVAGEVVRVGATRLEGGIVARRRDAVRRVVGGQLLELSRHEVLEPLEGRRPALLEGRVVLADLLVGPVVAVQQQGQLEAEPVDPRGVHVNRAGADRELDEVVVRASGRAEVKVHCDRPSSPACRCRAAARSTPPAR